MGCLGFGTQVPCDTQGPWLRLAKVGQISAGSLVLEDLLDGVHENFDLELGIWLGRCLQAELYQQHSNRPQASWPNPTDAPEEVRSC